MRAKARRRPRPSRFLNGIDFWAFLSVELVLLMIFMVNGPSPHANRSSVDLALTTHAAPMHSAIREDAMLITVSRDGNVYFGAGQIQLDRIPARIQDSVRNGSERKVYLKVDTRAKYRDAAVVIDQVHQTGIENIGLITDQRLPMSQ
jgi:biopolymer transport protein ExbD